MFFMIFGIVVVRIVELMVINVVLVIIVSSMGLCLDWRLIVLSVGVFVIFDCKIVVGCNILYCVDCVWCLVVIV